MCSVQMIVNTAHEGLKKTMQDAMPSVPWQLRLYHLQSNAQAYILKVSMRGKVAPDFNQVFKRSDCLEAGQKLKGFTQPSEKKI